MSTAFSGAAPLAATSPAGAPQVKVVSIVPGVVGPSQSTTVTWSADKKGTYSVRVGGSDCSSGTQVASGSYNNPPANAATKVGVAALPAEGANTVRVCVTASAKTGSATGTVTRDTTPPTLSGTLTSSDSVSTAAYPGESVTVKVTASEPLSKLAVTCASSNVAMSASDSQHWLGVLGVTSLTPLGPLQCSAVGTDAVGNSSTASAITGVTVVPPAPSVSISSQPASSTTATVASFAWTTTGTITTTTCSLDGNSAGCSSPQGYSNLPVGGHTFTVTVSNAGGSNSASYTWTILPPPPTVAISSHPDASTTATDAGFAWTTGGTVTTTTCTLDGNTTGCTSPQTYSSLSLGTHTFTVTATNAGGSGTDSYTWTILPPPPTVAISSHPDASTTATDAGFAWTTVGAVTTTTCTLDGNATSCTSPQSYSSLGAGSHTFTVTVANEGGSDSDSYPWTIVLPPSGCAAPAPPGYTLTFCDDFDGPTGSAPDSGKWRVYGGATPSRWGSECFVDDRQHIYLDGSGHLVETATYNPDGVPCTNGSGPYESGGMDTGKFPSPLFALDYGQVEARIKVPCQSGYGMWPAWWMAGSSWPQSGEVDILEVLANSSHGYNAKQSIHGATSSGGVWSLSNSDISSALWCTDYHVYGVDWSPGQIEFLVDGVVQATFTPANMQSGWLWPFDSYAEKLFLDLQVGGSGGAVDNSTLPQSMTVDWIRVYQ